MKGESESRLLCTGSQKTGVLESAVDSFLESRHPYPKLRVTSRDMEGDKIEGVGPSFLPEIYLVFSILLFFKIFFIF